MAATMCTLSPFTPSTDQPCGVVMSEVISMNSALAKLLGVKPGHQAIMIHANMGDVNSWTAPSKDSSVGGCDMAAAAGGGSLGPAARPPREPTPQVGSRGGEPTPQVGSRAGAEVGSRLPRWGAEVGSPAPPLRGAGSTPGDARGWSRLP